MYKLPQTLLSKYEFVTLASKRAEQLQMGAPPRVVDTGRKVTVMAQEEVATGVVALWKPEQDEAVVPGEEE